MRGMTAVSLGVVIFSLFLPPIAGAAQPRRERDVSRGESVYRALCGTCHGQYGRGDGPAAQYLAASLPDFTDPAVLRRTSDEETLARLLEGRGAVGTTHTPMVIGEVLKSEALQDALAYIRTLSVPGKHVSIPAGRDIYTTFCWTCHGVKGDGQGPAAKNLVGVKPRDFTSRDFVIEGREEELHRTIFMGAAKSFHGSPYMPEWKTTLSRQQIQDVLEYLKTLKRPPR